MKTLYELCIDSITGSDFNKIFLSDFLLKGDVIKNKCLTVSMLPKNIQKDINFMDNIKSGGFFYKFENIENAILIQKNFENNLIIALDIYKLLNIDFNSPLYVRILNLGGMIDISLNFNFISYVDKNDLLWWALNIVKRRFYTYFLKIKNVDNNLKIRINNNIKKIIKKISIKIKKQNYNKTFQSFQGFDTNELTLENSFVVLKHKLEKISDKNVKYFLKEINQRYYVVKRNSDNQTLYSIIVGNVLNSDISKKKWYYEISDIINNNGVVLYNYCFENKNGVCVSDDERIVLKPTKLINKYSGLILCSNQNSITSYSSVLEDKKYFPNIKFPIVPDFINANNV